MKVKIGFIGGGNMAGSLIGGLLANGQYQPHEIAVFNPSKEKAARLQSKYSVTLMTSNEQLIEQSQSVILAIKPQVLQQVLNPLKAVFDAHQPLIISVVAGITTQSIEKWLGNPFSIIRIMPNTPSLVGAGACGAFANERVTAQQKNIADALMDSVGYGCWVNQQSDIDTVTALSGSGPAYFMLFIEALINSAQSAGLEPELAHTLALKTAQGAATLIEQSDVSIEQLIDNVTSPNGTTAAALNSFAQSELNKVVETAFDAARQRSQQLAIELS